MDKKENQKDSYQEELKKEINDLVEKYKVKDEVELEDLLKYGVHFGHGRARWNPKMKEYILAKKQGVHIMNLNKTKENLEKVAKIVKDKASKGAKILFVGTKRQAKDIVRQVALKTEMPYVVERWLGGTLTNFPTIKKRIDKLTILENLYHQGELKKYTKKEQANFKEKIEKFNKKMGGIKTLKELPQLMFVIDLVGDKQAVLEAKKMNIPVIAIADTNADPQLATEIIPANDDAVSSLKFILGFIASKIV
jgi:small subunit ribosomal protein S2